MRVLNVAGTAVHEAGVRSLQLAGGNDGKNRDTKRRAVRRGRVDRNGFRYAPMPRMALTLMARASHIHSMTPSAKGVILTVRVFDVESAVTAFLVVPQDRY